MPEVEYPAADRLVRGLAKLPDERFSGVNGDPEGPASEGKPARIAVIGWKCEPRVHAKLA